MVAMASVLLLCVLLLVTVVVTCCYCYMEGWAHAWPWSRWSLIRSCQKQGIHGYRVPDLIKLLSWESLKSVQKHGECFYVEFGKFVRLVVLDPFIIEQVLVQNSVCYEKASFLTSLEILGSGLFTSSGVRWANQRQLFGPCFLPKELKNHFEAIKTQSVDEMQRWTVLEKEAVDIHKRFLSLTVKLIGRIAFGEVIDSNTALEVYETFDHYLQNCKKSVCSPYFTFPGHSLIWSWQNRQFTKDRSHLLSLTKGLLMKHPTHSSSEGGKEGKLMHLMLNREKECTDFTRDLVLDNIATFLLAGHETTSSLLTWTVYLLATHPVWQERARAEVSSVEDLSWKSLSQLKTVSMILWESLRLFPPQPLLGRLCARRNEVRGFVIPEKMEVIVPVVALHHDKVVWGEDSEDFKPSRFANGINKASKNPLAFLPFGLGPRTCIGQSLALLEARIVLVLMLQKFSWELSPSYHHCPDVALTLQPRYGMPIILRSV